MERKILKSYPFISEELRIDSVAVIDNMLILGSDNKDFFVYNREENSFSKLHILFNNKELEEEYIFIKNNYKIKEFKYKGQIINDFPSIFQLTSDINGRKLAYISVNAIKQNIFTYDFYEK